FDPTAYARWIRTFEVQHLHSRHGAGMVERALHASWTVHQSTIHTALTSVEKLAEVLQSRTFPYVICHADLHAANLLRDHAGHVFVIDWDEVMLAPKERDFIFVREPQAEAFWEGYGQSVIDWAVLTYYRWERVIRDLIEYAGHVCFRDEWTEETKADLVQAFHQNLADGTNLRATYAAAAHLPGDLTVHIPKNTS
ncbi:MAG: aminoglycoside phosphotransferase family protein, partial [Chloroflexi bacterium]|nr:aminoglycoside phosphotransferase family protein [Chloroflexota bacterium]